MRALEDAEAIFTIVDIAAYRGETRVGGGTVNLIELDTLPTDEGALEEGDLQTWHPTMSN